MSDAQKSISTTYLMAKNNEPLAVDTRNFVWRLIMNRPFKFYINRLLYYNNYKL